MENIQEIINKLNLLNKKGFVFSIDDFGTGYSSFRYIKKLPVHTIKIDRSFIVEIPQSESDCLVVKAIISMAHALNIEVVAEGVETPEQVDFLNDLNCNIIQGYHYSQPLAQDDFINFVKKFKIIQ